MAQYNSAEKINNSDMRRECIQLNDLVIEPTDVMTGDRNQRRFLYYQLKMSMRKADGIDIIVSFLMESGVRMILKDLEEALDRGGRVRILTGNYLGITQPSALYLLKKELGNRIDLRFYSDKGRSFHPKSYIFHYKKMSEIYIGSSNISRSALTSGIEWNYRFNSITDNKNYRLLYQTFEELFFEHSIIIDDEELHRYSKSWHRPAIDKDLARYDKLEEEADTKVEMLFQPRGAQIEALYALENSRADGAVKALVHAATGVGKTYLAAFDSVKFNRVLFVAHREEILRQAAASFKNVRRSDDYGFFYGKQKDTDKAVIFASVETLGREEYLREEYFPADYFDYIVIDEFHHAVNAQYRKIADYFKPQFMLGLTATPERMDGKNIYELCDYNVPYEISLKEAINKGMLVPFHYYGIYDETDYSGLHPVKGKYVVNELTDIYKNNVRRFDLIYKYYMKYHSRRALGFCCSRQHAEEMAKEFCRRGIPSVAVYSNNAESEFSEDREKAIERLKKQEVKVIFSVDMFNEGLDIASLDMVMFLRPTESSTIFLQQLGRGLRTYKGKEYLNVLDFIGNYEKAGKVSLLLGGEKTWNAGETGVSTDTEYPDDCLVDFDMRLIDLFREWNRRSLSVRERIYQEYYRVKELLDGKVPTRMELFTYMEDDLYQYCLKHAKENPFRQYLKYLYDLKELSEDEEELYTGLGREFLALIETTDMTRVYKMPILYAFYNDGEIRLEVTEEEVLACWKKFFDMNKNWRDFSENITYKEYKAMTDKQHLTKAKTMPVKFLKESGKGFFIDKDGYMLAVREDLRFAVKNKAFCSHMKDILEYRTMDYYRRRYEMK